MTDEGHKNTIRVTKLDGKCSSCGKGGSVTQINTFFNMYDFKSISFCNKCLQWLKNKLRGF